jgi:Leucine-rich repeat (LRR) protein
LSFIDKYDPAWSIDSQLGEGGFSKVYKIVKEEFGHKYYSAMKVIPVPQSSSELRELKDNGLFGDSLNTYISQMAKDLINEINLVKEFEGTTNIVNYEDHKVIPKEGEPGYLILIRMELLESLAAIIRSRTLGEDDVLKVGTDICRALELLEMRKVIHRDVKPENIFLSKFGNYKLGDFGIARQIEKTMSGMTITGTKNYMAPEVFKGHEYGATVDLYSLGIVIYRILNGGRVPFLPPQTTVLRPSDIEAAFNMRMRGEPLPFPDGASPELSRIILKACAYEHRDRFASASEMRVALEEYAQSKISQKVAFKSPAPKPVNPVVEPKPVIPAIKPKPSVEVSPSAGSGFGSSDESTVKPSAPKPVIKPTPPVAPKSVAEVPPSTDGDIAINGELYFRNIDHIDIQHKKMTSEDLAKLKFFTKLRSLLLYQCELNDISLLSELINLKELYLHYNQITDIRPLWGLKNLKELVLHSNQITDISPLSGLKKLEKLLMSSNQITDMIPLSGLNNLKKLNLGHNHIIDISPLSGLKKLEYLRLDNNQTIDLRPLSGLKKLKELWLSENQITDIRPLSGLNILGQLYLDNNQITDVGSLSGLKKLYKLHLEANQITDIRPLSRLRLIELHLGANQITDLSPLFGLDNLKELWLSENQITDLRPLSGLHNLKILLFSSNQITDLRPISGLHNLKTLWLSSNQITDLRPISGLKNLEELFLSRNQITDLRPLSGLKKLKSLNLDNITTTTDLSPLLKCLELDYNQITDISLLSGPKKLEELALCENQISDLSPLSGLKKLEKLWLSSNKTTDLRPLSGLKKLKELKLDYNQITDISSLAKLTNLTTLFLYANPIPNDQIDNLQIALPRCHIHF